MLCLHRYVVLVLSREAKTCGSVLTWTANATYRGINHEVGSFDSNGMAQHAEDSPYCLISISLGPLSCLTECTGASVVHDCIQAFGAGDSGCRGITRAAQIQARVSDGIHSIKDYDASKQKQLNV